MTSIGCLWHRHIVQAIRFHLLQFQGQPDPEIVTYKVQLIGIKPDRIELPALLNKGN